MISITILMALMWIHFISDFVWQSHKMACNKSSHNGWLLWHVAVYSLLFLIFFGPVYAAVNAVLHFITDYITSRITAKLYTEDRTHEFFVVIGLDQAIHLTCLVITYNWLQPTMLWWIL